MKTYLYLIALLFILHSCLSPEKMIEKGKYDLVLKRSIAIFKLKKKKPLKWVKAIEKSFALANDRDLKWIEKYQKSGGISFWKKVYYKAGKIEARQHKIAQFLPLVAETGYAATFHFFDAQLKKQEAKSWIANLYFVKAKNEIKMVRGGSKRAALLSIALIDSALLWREDIYQAQELRQEAVDSATVKVALFTHFNEKYSRASIDIETYLQDNFKHYSQPYLQVEINPSDNFDSDYYFFVYPIYINIGGEYESVTETSYSEEIVTGCETIQEWNATDSVWVTKTVEIIETVYGTLIEYEQSKNASMQVLISIEGAYSYHVFKEQKLNASYYFSNSYTEVEGDERAVGCIIFSGSWESYPSDWLMESYMSISIAHQVKRYIKKYNWWFE